MAARTRANRRRRAKRVPAKALKASADHRRASTVGFDNPFADVGAAYLDLPRRILVCRTPFHVWLEYVHFGQRLVSAVSTMCALQSRHLPR